MLFSKTPSNYYIDICISNTSYIDNLFISVDKLFYPNAYIASSEFNFVSLPWFNDYSLLLFWFFFFSLIVIFNFFLIIFFFLVKFYEIKRPIYETRGISRSQFGDSITSVIPLTWSISMLIHANTHAYNFDSNVSDSFFSFEIIAYQWGWNYFFPADIIDLFTNFPKKVGTKYVSFDNSDYNLLFELNKSETTHNQNLFLFKINNLFLLFNFKFKWFFSFFITNKNYINFNKYLFLNDFDLSFNNQICQFNTNKFFFENIFFKFFNSFNSFSKKFIFLNNYFFLSQKNFFFEKFNYINKFEYFYKFMTFFFLVDNINKKFFFTYINNIVNYFIFDNLITEFNSFFIIFSKVQFLTFFSSINIFFWQISKQKFNDNYNFLTTFFFIKNFFLKNNTSFFIFSSYSFSSLFTNYKNSLCFFNFSFPIDNFYCFDYKLFFNTNLLQNFCLFSLYFNYYLFFQNNYLLNQSNLLLLNIYKNFYIKNFYFSELKTFCFFNIFLTKNNIYQNYFWYVCNSLFLFNTTFTTLSFDNQIFFFKKYFFIKKNIFLFNYFFNQKHFIDLFNFNYEYLFFKQIFDIKLREETMTSFNLLVTQTNRFLGINISMYDLYSFRNDTEVEKVGIEMTMLKTIIRLNNSLCWIFNCLKQIDKNRINWWLFFNELFGAKYIFLNCAVKERRFFEKEGFRKNSRILKTMLKTKNFFFNVFKPYSLNFSTTGFLNDKNLTFINIFGLQFLLISEIFFTQKDLSLIFFSGFKFSNLQYFFFKETFSEFAKSFSSGNYFSLFSLSKWIVNNSISQDSFFLFKNIFFFDLINFSNNLTFFVNIKNINTTINYFNFWNLNWENTIFFKLCEKNNYFSIDFLNTFLSQELATTRKSNFFSFNKINNENIFYLFFLKNFKNFEISQNIFFFKKINFNKFFNNNYFLNNLFFFKFFSIFYENNFFWKFNNFFFFFTFKNQSLIPIKNWINTNQNSFNFFNYNYFFFNTSFYSSYYNNICLTKYFNFIYFETFFLKQIFDNFFLFNCSSLFNTQNSSKIENFYSRLDVKVNSIKRLRVNKGVCLPSNLFITVICTSKDVIHSWAIPALGVKIDCIPGFYTQRKLKFKYKGLFWGQCMEVCGRYHHWMPILIRIVNKDFFIFWCLSLLKIFEFKLQFYKNSLFEDLIFLKFINNDNSLKFSVLKDFYSNFNFLSDEYKPVSLYFFYQN